MENTITYLSADNLDIKLTEDKLFINTAVSNEAFALRSVNGIGVVDLVDDFNAELNFWKQKRFTAMGWVIIGVFVLILAFVLFKLSVGAGAFFFLIGGVLIYVGYLALKRNEIPPKLLSAVRIMMSGGNRDFKFDKTGVKSGNVAEFVASVEATLTAYQKNNG